MKKFKSNGVSYDSPFIINFARSTQVCEKENVSGGFQPILQNGKGVVVEDVDENSYIDVSLGGGGVTFGHGYDFERSEHGTMTLSSSFTTSSCVTATELLCTSKLEESTGMKCLGYAQSFECSVSMVKKFFSNVVVHDLFSDDAKIIEDARVLSLATREKGQAFVINETVGTGRFAYPSIALQQKIPACGVIFGPGLANGYPFYPVCVSASKYKSAITTNLLKSLAPFTIKPSGISELMFATAIRSMEYFRKHCVVFNLQRLYKALRSGLKSGIVAHKLEDKIQLDERSGRIIVKLINPAAETEKYKIFTGLVRRGVYVEKNELGFSPCFSMKIEHVVRITLAFKAALGEYLNSFD